MGLFGKRKYLLEFNAAMFDIEMGLCYVEGFVVTIVLKLGCGWLQKNIHHTDSWAMIVLMSRYYLFIKLTW